MAIMSPFTSFPLEAARIYMTAAVEHPLRAAVAQSIPLSIAATSMLASGMSPEEYWDTVRQAADFHQGRIMIPLDRDTWVDLTNVIPLADLQTNEGPWNLLLNGPFWDIINAARNVDPKTSRPVFGPETDWRDKVTWGAKQGLPPFASKLADNLMAANEERPVRRFGEDMTTGKAFLDAFIPMARTYTTDEIQAQGAVADKAKLRELKGRGRSIQRNPAVGDDTKDRYMENLLDQAIKLRGGR